MMCIVVGGRTQGSFPEEDASHSKIGKPGLWAWDRVVKTERALVVRTGALSGGSRGAMED